MFTLPKTEFISEKSTKHPRVSHHAAPFFSAFTHFLKKYIIIIKKFERFSFLRSLIGEGGNKVAICPNCGEISIYIEDVDKIK